MEVGAIKQAFNNELILLKKKMTQAKIQIIHKLTRKAKTFVEKKAPEPIKEKLKRKAESAINEVLILKKIQPKDLAKFAIIHKGKLNDHLNKPAVDQDKACARLLLHKSLQDKYEMFRIKFASVPIEDLLMSREERRKAKKEARDKQKNKKNGTEASKIVNSEGNWKVEDIEMSEKIEDTKDMESDRENDMSESDNNDDVESSNNEQNHSDAESDVSLDNEDRTLAGKSTDSDNESINNHRDSSQDKCGKASSVGKFVKRKSAKCDVDNTINTSTIFKKADTKSIPELDVNIQIKKVCNKKKRNKNRNLTEKLVSRKFKKDLNDSPMNEASKIVDPFFITSTGESYMSVAELRPPDEIKEVHKQGNRKLRRAVMFGHVPKIKPRKDTFRNEDNRFNKQNGFNKNDTFKKVNDNEAYDGGKTNFIDKRNSFDRKHQDSKPEKLHPSWEAKKRQSGILPFQGKKIVFDES